MPVAAEPIDVASLSIPGCAPFLRGGVVGGLGTVPAPTPTPMPTPQTPPPPRAPESARAEVGSYLQIALPVARAAAHWTGITDALWAEAEGRPGRGALIFAESRRVAALCGAIALAIVPPEAEAVHTPLAIALLDRQAWAAAAGAELQALEEATNGKIETRRAAAAIALEGALGALNALAAAYELDDITLNGALRAVENDLGRVAIDVPPGWLVVRADAQTLLMAPLALQAPGVIGVGPGRDSYGTALRIRRLRNPAGRTLNDLAEAVRPLLDGFGEELDRLDLRLDGYPGVRWILEDAGAGWVTRFAVVLAGDYTFTMEMGCPRILRGECETAADDVLGRITLRP